MPNVYFVSGHLDLSPLEFEIYYKPQLEKALEDSEACFVVGDARGTDRMAQDFLKTRTSKVNVYHMHNFPRNCVGPFNKVGGFSRDSERDIAMTRHSTHDITWVKPGREGSGAEKNLLRRQKPVKSDRYGNETKR